MNCAWYEEKIAKEGTDLWIDRRPSAGLLAHARECAICSVYLDRELELRHTLLKLADTSRKSEPSASVKRMLLAELDLRSSAHRKVFTFRAAMALAAILCLVLGLGLWRYRRPSSSNPTITPAVALQQKAPVPVVAGASINQPSQKPLVVAATPKSSAPRRSLRAPAAAYASDFYPVIMCDSLTCAGPAVTVRVELPSSPLVSRTGGGRPIMADLLVGDDGLIRGVRVLK